MQLCQLKPTLLTRGDDLVRLARRVLHNCLIVDDDRDDDDYDDPQTTLPSVISQEDNNINNNKDKHTITKTKNTIHK